MKYLLTGAFLLLFSLVWGQQHPNRVVAFPPDVDSIYALLSDTSDNGRGMWANREFVLAWLDVTASAGSGCWDYDALATNALSPDPGTVIVKSWTVTSDSIAITQIDADGTDRTDFLASFGAGDYLVFSDGTAIAIKANLGASGGVQYYGGAGVPPEPADEARLCLTAAGISTPTLFNIPRGRDSVVVDTVEWDNRTIKVGDYANGDADTLEFRMAEATSQSNVVAFTAEAVPFDARLELYSNASSWRLEASRDGLGKFTAGGSGALLNFGSNTILGASGFIDIYSTGSNIDIYTEDSDQIEVESNTLGGTGSYLNLSEDTGGGWLNLYGNRSPGLDVGFSAQPSSLFHDAAIMGEAFSFSSDTANFVSAGPNGIYLSSSDGYYYGSPLADVLFGGFRYLPPIGEWDTIQTVNPATGEIGLRTVSSLVSEVPTLFNVERSRDTVAVDTVDWAQGLRHIDLSGQTNGDLDTLEIFTGGLGGASGEIHLLAGTSTIKSRLSIAQKGTSAWRLNATQDGFSPSVNSYIDIGYTALNLFSASDINITTDDQPITLNSFSGVAADESIFIMDDDVISLTTELTAEPSGIVIDDIFTDGAVSIGQIDGVFYLEDTANYVSAGDAGVYINAPDGLYLSGNSTLGANPQDPPLDNTLDSLLVYDPGNGELHLREVSSLPDIEIKSFGLESPTSSEDIAFFYTDDAITITQVNDVVDGSSPSLDYNIGYASTRSGVLTDVWNTDRTVSSTSGSETTSFDNATISAGSWVVITTSAASGTIDFVNITIEYER